MFLDNLPHHPRVLLLQGPIGPFFARLARFLRQRGAEVYKINFNGGDALYYPAGLNPLVYHYRDQARRWKYYLRTMLVENRIEAIYLFGDCRFYHRVAVQMARRLGVEIYVFEEGYVRPDYITLERGGVNGYSSLPRDRAFYDRSAPRAATPSPHPAGTRIVWPTTFYAMLYAFAGALLHVVFPYYRHHRAYFSVGHWLRRLRGWLRKPLYALQQRKQLPRLRGPLSKQYFLVPLQVHQDAQMLVHGHFPRTSHFIQYVITSFAMEAPAHRHLVFKHHPLDRGFRNHGRLIRALARQLGVADRVHYVHDLHLPTLLRHALGTVVINSTVGFSSLLHGTPVKTHGKAVYNLPGLVHQGSLASFWHDPEPIDQRLHKNFRRYLIAHTQINGSFYFWRGFRRGRELGSGPVSGATEPVSSPPGHAGFGTALSHQRGAVPVERKINLGHNHLPPGGP